MVCVLDYMNHCTLCIHCVGIDLQLPTNFEELVGNFFLGHSLLVSLFFSPALLPSFHLL